ncbi:hypothetical protein LLE49_14625 [Alicyclobacillus tolerans]|uniref:hypothetical protein n=1 Tax=Alicyclobacillus tolerans TaxID=90970 RepID=UPI001F29D84B|nr:hypothetical protein [Alicyclobacillus tolerans]MCF8565957.1 hypothetical protein [Alicyclobacillus tolerans]
MQRNTRHSKKESLILGVRNGVTAIAVIGVGILAGYGLSDLRPSWEWTQEQYEEQRAKDANGSS